MHPDTLSGFFVLITLILFASVIAAPFLLAYKYTFNRKIAFLVISLLVTFLLSTASAYWAEDLSYKIVCKIYGFNDDGMNDGERLENVSVEYRSYFQDLYDSRNGIGWPLKVIMMYIIFVIPYNIVIFFVILIRKKLLES